VLPNALFAASFKIKLQCQFVGEDATHNSSDCVGNSFSSDGTNIAYLMHTDN